MPDLEPLVRCAHMSRVLFAERFLVVPVGDELPEPAGYDETRSISIAADGRPFIEAGAVVATRTLTEAEAEGADDDEGYGSASGRASNANPQFLATRTATFVDAEGQDTDEDRLAALPLHTDTRAAGEKPDAPFRTAAPGEPVDYDAVAFLGTVTKAAGESSD
jgi:hypothetical protein